MLLALLAAHLCHRGVLWTEEGLPMAAAREMAHGKTLYRDAWFDKPPLVPAVYLLWGVRDGVPLRIAGALYDLLACWLAFLSARNEPIDPGLVAASALVRKKEQAAQLTSAVDPKIRLPRLRM